VSPSDDKKGRKAPPAKQAKAKPKAKAKPAARDKDADDKAHAKATKPRSKAKPDKAKAKPAGKTVKAPSKTVREIEAELHGDGPARKHKKAKPGSALVVVESPAKARTIGSTSARASP